MGDPLHQEKLDRIPTATSAGHLQMLEDEGYEITDVGGEDVWLHGDGRDDCTVWVEVIDGRPMLCVGDPLGGDARYVPCIVANIMSLETEDSP